MMPSQAPPVKRPRLAKSSVGDDRRRDEVADAIEAGREVIHGDRDAPASFTMPGYERVKCSR